MALAGVVNSIQEAARDGLRLSPLLAIWAFWHTAQPLSGIFIPAASHRGSSLVAARKPIDG